MVLTFGNVYATARSWTPRLAGFGLLLLSVLAGVASLSRGGFLALVAVGIYLILRSRRRVATIVALAAALLLIYPLVPPEWTQRISTLRTANQRGDTGETRLYMWGLAWKVFRHHPVLGVGVNNIGRHLPDFEEKTGRRPLWGRACHSLYFTLLAESGTVGTVIW